MTTTKSLIKETECGCGKCRRPFPNRTPIAVHAESDPQLVEQLRDLSLLTSTCTHCGQKGVFPAVFLYDNPNAGEVLLVVPENYQIRFQFVQELFDVFLKEYAGGLPPEDKERLSRTKRRVVPLHPFLIMLESPVAKGMGLGTMHFYPFPKVDIPHRGAAFRTPISETLGQFEVAFAEGNHPEFYESLWELVKDEFQFDKSYLRSRTIPTEQRPVATYGIPELMFYVGSNLVVPVFVGVLSTLLATLVLERRQGKQNLEAADAKAKDDQSPHAFLIARHAHKLLKAQANNMDPTDEVCVRLRVVEDSQEYTFRGSLHDVWRELKKFRRELLHSVRLPGDCHMCVYVASAYVDLTLSGVMVGPNEALRSRFGKVFAKTTRVRYATEDQEEYLHKSVEVCMKAKQLMEKKDYEGAAVLLQDVLRGEESSLEVLYNYALCAKELGRDDAADFFFEQVLVRAFNLPSLEDAERLVMGVFSKKGGIREAE